MNDPGIPVVVRSFLRKGLQNILYKALYELLRKIPC